MLKQCGFTLVEILLALFLSALLFLVLFASYISLKLTYNFVDALSEVQENGRFASYFLNYAIHMAGNNSCNEGPKAGAIIIGYNSQNLPDFMHAVVKVNTDIIVVAGCIKVHDKNKWMRTAYYIADTGRKNAAGAIINALYRKTENTKSQELVANITNMKISYGISDDSINISNYLTEDKFSSIELWQKVRSVNIALLLNSQENAYKKPQKYFFQGKNFNPDRLLHKEWDIYVALRNHI